MRRWLRDRYVGAVLVGFLLYNAVTAVIRVIENPVLMWIQRTVQHSALSAGQPWINKGQLYATLVDGGLYLVFGIALGLWIYASDRTESAAVKASE